MNTKKIRRIALVPFALLFFGCDNTTVSRGGEPGTTGRERLSAVRVVEPQGLRRMPRRGEWRACGGAGADACR